MLSNAVPVNAPTLSKVSVPEVDLTESDPFTNAQASGQLK
jgi:hypothetical protein